MLDLGRRLMLACLLALQATMSLCGPGHHALDGAFEPLLAAEASSRRSDDATPSLSADPDCPACLHLSHAVTTPAAPPAKAGDFEAPAPDCIDATLRRAHLPLRSTPRAPPARIG